MKETRNTIQRSLVLNAVRQLAAHPTANEIYLYIARDHPNISRGTVYRNLNLLALTGEIRRVEAPNTADRFDFTLADHYHIHCAVCGCVEDVDMPYQQDLERQVRDAHGFRIVSHDIVFKGICPLCLDRPDAKAGDS